MDRMILFRGRREDTGEWVYGSYAVTGGDAFIIKREPVFDEVFGGEVPDCISVKPETVGQYVGQEDREGRQIFEGDIIRYTVYGGGQLHGCGQGVVRYDSANCIFHIVTEADGSSTGIHTDLDVSVGNIYETPERQAA